MSIEAIYENGVLRPVEPLDLPEGTRVRIPIEKADAAHRAMREIQALAEEGKNDGPRGSRDPAAVSRLLDELAAMPVEGKADDPRAARDHDHYLYGAPRRG